MVDITDNFEIKKKIQLDEKYCLLNINEWTSTVCNVYHQNAFKYFENYDVENIKIEEEDDNGNLKFTTDRFIKFNDIWLIYPFPCSIHEEQSSIWTNVKNIYNIYKKMEKETCVKINKKINI